MADSKRDINGPWVFVNKEAESVSVLDGLKEVAPRSTKLTYAPGVQMWRKFPSMFDAILVPIRRRYGRKLNSGRNSIRQFKPRMVPTWW